MTKQRPPKLVGFEENIYRGKSRWLLIWKIYSKEGTESYFETFSYIPQWYPGKIIPESSVLQDATRRRNQMIGLAARALSNAREVGGTRESVKSLAIQAAAKIIEFEVRNKLTPNDLRAIKGYMQ